MITPFTIQADMNSVFLFREIARQAEITHRELFEEAVTKMADELGVKIPRRKTELET